MQRTGLKLAAARGDAPIGSWDVVDDAPVTIGRWSGATLPLEEAAGPVDVVLDPEGRGRWRLIALAPSGCEVNGRAVRRAVVGSGDRLRVGPYVIELSGDHAEVDAPASRGSGEPERALLATLRWRGTVLDRRMLAPGETLTVGRGARVTFALPVEATGAKAHAWAAAACVGDEWHVALDSPLRAVTLEGQPLLSASVRQDGPKLPRGVANSAAWAPLRGAIRLEAGVLSIELERVDRASMPRITRLPWWTRPEGYRSIISAMVVVTIVAMLRMPHEPPFNPTGDLIKERELLARYQPPAPAKPVELKKITRTEGDDKEGGAERSKGREGQAGRPDAPERSAARGGRASDREVVQQHALLQALEEGTAAQLLSGGALSAANAVGHLDGPAVGDAKGTLGLGLRGDGTGGGGASTESVGVGPVGARGSGLGQAGGVGKLKGKGNSALGLDMPERVEGGLDREVIRRVILSHRAQIRYCYEKELAQKPDLEGRVLVEFVIGADGRVSSARAAEDSLQTPAVGQCLVSKVRTWKFPEPKGGGVVVVGYPFMFKPAGQGN